MAMGKRKGEQAPMWVASRDLPVSPGHPFYAKLTAILDEAGFDRFAEAECQQFYAPVMGRPSLPPGRYFRLLLVGYFEGLDSERGIAWRAADSLAVRSFVGLGLDTVAPDHSTLSRTRRLIAVETHRAVGVSSQTGLAEGNRKFDRTDLHADSEVPWAARPCLGSTKTKTWASRPWHLNDAHTLCPNSFPRCSFATSAATASEMSSTLRASRIGTSW